MTLVHNLSLNIEFEHNICRGCLTVSSKKLPPINKRLLIFFKDISKIIISENTKLPHRLCDDCLKDLTQCFNFKIKCLHADRILSELLQTSTYSNGQFDLNNLRKERQKLLHDYTPDSSQTFTENSKLPHQTSSNLSCGLNTKKKKPSVNNDSKLPEHNEDDINYISPEVIYESISNNFYVIDSLSFDSFNKDHPFVENAAVTEQVFKDEADLFECEVEDAMSNELYSEDPSNTQSEITNEDVIGMQDADYNTSDNNTNETVKHSKKRKTKSGMSEIQKSLEKSLQRRTLRNEMKAIRSNFSGPKKVKKRSNSDVYCPFDEGSVNIVRLTTEQQIGDLEAARVSKRYIDSPYKCELCAKGFVHELTLQDHLVKHSESAGSFVCGICQLRYGSLHSLRNHHVAVHEERLECKHCGKVLSGRSSMAQHVAKHKGMNRFPACKVCGKVSNSPTSHYRHLRSHKPVPHKCTQCPRIFKDKSNLLDHSTRVHSGIKNFECDICKYSFATKTGLKAHAVKHSNQRDFYCVECDIRFKTQASLTHHLNASAKHANPDYLKFQCDQCEKRYDTALKLKLHVECSHLHIYKYPCEKCPSKFQTSGALKHHRQRTHEGKVLPKKHVCNLCDKAFTYRTTLMNHILIHTGEQPHICDICKRPFRQKAAMQTHIKLVHLKIKRHIAKRKGTKADISNEEKD